VFADFSYFDEEEEKEEEEEREEGEEIEENYGDWVKVQSLVFEDSLSLQVESAEPQSSTKMSFSLFQQSRLTPDDQALAQAQMNLHLAC
jgi:hypothetical protein